MSARAQASILAASLSVLAMTAMSGPAAAAEKIHTSAATAGMCPLLKAELDKAQLDYACNPGRGI